MYFADFQFLLAKIHQLVINALNSPYLKVLSSTSYTETL
jgi:hypothetical protein